MNGIPIDYLHGGDDNSNNLVGLLGLDGSAADDQKLYDHLVATRNSLAANPSMVKSIQNPFDMLQMLNYAIAYWNTPRRDEALAILEKEEGRLIKSGAILNGVDENNEPLQGFFSKIKSAAKKVIRKVGDKAKAAVITAVPASAKAFAVAKTLVNKKASKSNTPVTPTSNAPASPTAIVQATSNQPVNTNTNTQNKMPDVMVNPNPGFMEKFVTPKNILIGGLIVGGIVVGYKLMTKKSAPKAITSGSQPLNGVRRRKKIAKRKPAAPATRPKPRKAITGKVRTVKVR